MIAAMVKEWRRLLRMASLPWILLAYIALPVLVAVAMLKMMAGQQGMMPQTIPLMGGYSLSVIATWQTLLLAAVAPWLAAGLIAAEREQGTLAYLLAGRCTLFAGIVGKYFAVVSFLILILLSGMPLFALPILVGGVNWALLGRVIAMEAATVLGMSGVGLVISAAARRVGSAAVAGLAAALLLTIGTGLIGQFVPAALPAHARDKMIMISAVAPMGVPGGMPASGAVPVWLKVNPLVGLNNALGYGGNGQGLFLFGLPGAGAGPFWHKLSLWQLQGLGGAALAICAVALAWVMVSLGLRWRWPLWRLGRRAALAAQRQEEVAASD